MTDRALDMLETCCKLAQCESAGAVRERALAALMQWTNARAGVLYGLDYAGTRLVSLSSSEGWRGTSTFDLEEAQRDATAIMAVFSGDPVRKVTDPSLASQLREQVFAEATDGDILAVAVHLHGSSPGVVFLLLTDAPARPEWEAFARLAFLLGRRLSVEEASREEASVLDARLSQVSRVRARLAAQVEADLAQRLVGDSEPMQALRNEILRLAPSDLSVLILGETGAGKELVARELHRLSTRRAGPFVALNVAATPPGLLEDELFGHVRGSFTGSTGARKGLIAAARGGTLFLDEIGDMPAELQAKLLRVLQERRFRPIGADQEVEADFRLLSATHRDLRGQARSGAFRADLYYRLASTRIVSPPLRERGSDVLQLARLFIERNHAAGAQARLAPEAETALREATFDGNVRELEAAIRRACAFAGERLVIEKADLELEEVGGPAGIDAPSSTAFIGDLPLPDAVERFERQIISDTITRCGGAREPMAKALGIPLRTLADKLKKHGLADIRNARSSQGA